MTHPRLQVHTVHFVQHGSTSTLRVFDDLYHVVEEVWEGPRLIDSRIQASYATEADARAHVDRIQEEHP